MNRALILVMVLPLATLEPTPAASAQAIDKPKQAAAIEQECGLKTGTITVAGDEIRLQPAQDEDYEKVDCALARLNKSELGKVGFVGNEADPNAILKPPLRYVAEGSDAEIAALIKAAKADKWVIKTVTASRGVTVITFESGAAMTNGQANNLLDRIWKMEFGDIAFGNAPRKLSEPNPFDD